MLQNACMQAALGPPQLVVEVLQILKGSPEIWLEEEHTMIIGLNRDCQISFFSGVVLKSCP